MVYGLSALIVNIKFVRFGREDNTMVLVTVGGSLVLKILKRTAHFENLEMASGPLMNQNIKVTFCFNSEHL